MYSVTSSSVTSFDSFFIGFPGLLPFFCLSFLSLSIKASVSSSLPSSLILLIIVRICSGDMLSFSAIGASSTSVIFPMRAAMTSVLTSSLVRVGFSSQSNYMYL